MAGSIIRDDAGDGIAAFQLMKGREGEDRQCLVAEVVGRRHPHLRRRGTQLSNGIGHQSFLSKESSPDMNTANLQLEGLLMAIAGLNQMLVAKGVVSVEEIDKCLARYEQTVLGDDRVVEDLSPANRDVIAFPVRLLRLANNMSDGAGTPTFAELARMVGETKGPDNDQL